MSLMRLPSWTAVLLGSPATLLVASYWWDWFLCRLALLLQSGPQVLVGPGRTQRLSCGAAPAVRPAPERWVLGAELALRRRSRVLTLFLASPVRLSSLERNIWLKVEYNTLHLFKNLTSLFFTLWSVFRWVGHEVGGFSFLRLSIWVLARYVINVGGAGGKFSFWRCRYVVNLVVCSRVFPKYLGKLEVLHAQNCVCYYAGK